MFAFYLPFVNLFWKKLWTSNVFVDLFWKKRRTLFSVCKSILNQTLIWLLLFFLFFFFSLSLRMSAFWNGGKRLRVNKIEWKFGHKPLHHKMSIVKYESYLLIQNQILPNLNLHFKFYTLWLAGSHFNPGPCSDSCCQTYFSETYFKNWKNLLNC